MGRRVRCTPPYYLPQTIQCHVDFWERQWYEHERIAPVTGFSN